MEKPFYADGLRFSCTRCSACCRYESGFVYLSAKDLSLLAAECQMDYTGIVKTYCRWVSIPWRDGEQGRECLSLKEKSNYDCVFWSAGGDTKNAGCTVYNARPLQCRTFPFWRNVASSPEAWEMTAEGCPGIGKGVLYSRERIEACLAERSAEPLLYRRGSPACGPGGGYREA